MATASSTSSSDTMGINPLSWARWFLATDIGTQAILVGLPLLFCLAAPFAYRRRQTLGVWMLWIGMLVPLIPLGWYQWATSRGHDGPDLPLFNIAIYALPIGAVTAVGAHVVRWCATRQQSIPRQAETAFLAIVASAPVLMPLATYGAMIVYGLTGGFI